MDSTYLTAWRLALFSFAAAALSGALMRHGMIAGLPAGLQLGDVRHAHSHLMFFAWATPAVMLLGTEAARRAGATFRAGPRCAIAAVAAGLLAYTPFLLSGYRLLPVLGRELPLSMMASGLNGAVWYVFALLYWRATAGTIRTRPLRFFDGAVVSLLIASLGALLLAIGGMTGTATAAQMDAFVDMFLTLFADGWFGLGVLGALLLSVPPPAGSTHTVPTHTGGSGAGALGSGAAADALGSGAGAFGRRVAHALSSRLGSLAWLLAFALALRTLGRLAVDAYGLTGLLPVERGGGLLAAIAWLLVVGTLLLDASAARSESSGAGDAVTRSMAGAVLVLIAVKAVFEVVIAFPAGEALVVGAGLRIVLLHAFLLGAVSLGLASSMRAMLGRAAWRGLPLFAAAVAVMLALLLPLTGLWPTSLSGPWTLRAAFYSSFGPAASAFVALLLSSARGRLASGQGAQRSPTPGPSRRPA